MNVKLGDRVRRGQLLAKLDDSEIVEQVRQAEASHKVAEATIRQREADLNLALTNVERSRNLYGRQLLPKQTLDDAEARYIAAVAQLDLSQAQLAQSAARLEELRINLANTNVVSPVNGFVGKRNVDPGAWVSQNAGVASIVDISRMRLVANVVEKDLRLVSAATRPIVEVDAYPGEKFSGQIARVSPVLDPGTRTAPMEVEIPNPHLPLEARDVREGQPRSRRRTSNVAARPQGRTRRFARGSAACLSGQRGQPRAVQAGEGRPRGQRAGARFSRALPRANKVISTGAGALRRNDQLAIAGQAASGRPRERSGRAAAPRGGHGRGLAAAAAAARRPARAAAGRRAGTTAGHQQRSGADGPPESPPTRLTIRATGSTHRSDYLHVSASSDRSPE